ncbi:hypothetical protein N9A72_00055 [bacterium]|nr:hypothetical protein [bacterium]
MLKRFAYFVIIIMFLIGCDRHPLSRLTDPTNDGALNKTVWGDWVIYDDDMRTRGAVMFIPSNGDHQSIDFYVDDSESDHKRDKCIKYTWDGGDLYWEDEGDDEHSWAGVKLITAPNWRIYGETADLTPGGYTKIEFFAKGDLPAYTTVHFKGPGGYDVIDNVSLGESWNKYAIPLTADLTEVKEFFIIVIEYPPGTAGPEGSGATIYVDDIMYVK